ncbi:MAG: hypothetical protein M3O62_14450 [Pseudomonadota bacterium]|nr:hypothetical protein [Pseudomonadota bacterium]
MESNENEPNYLMEMLTSTTNVVACLGVALLGTVLSYRYGAAGFAVPVILGMGAEIVAAMFIPSMSTFRNKVDRQFRRDRRMKLIEGLRLQLAQNGVNHNNEGWDRYNRLCSLHEAMEGLRASGRGGLTVNDVERFGDARVDHLSLWMSLINLEQRAESANPRSLENRMSDLKRQMEIPGADRSVLERALKDLERLRAGLGNLTGRRATIETKMMSLLDTAEEVYHMASVSGGSTGSSAQLQEALERLRIKESVERSLDLDDPLASLSIPSASPTTARAAAAPPVAKPQKQPTQH